MWDESGTIKKVTDQSGTAACPRKSGQKVMSDEGSCVFNHAKPEQIDHVVDVSVAMQRQALSRYKVQPYFPEDEK